MRAIRSLTVLWLLTIPAAATAAPDDVELKRLHALLATLDREQQVLFQEFQMLQSARVTNTQRLYLTYPNQPTIQNYDDVVRQYEQVRERDDALRGELDALQARFREIQEKKRPVIDRIYALTLRASAEP